MTNLITRARKEWLEVHKSPEGAPDGEAWHYTLPCPPEVVAALLVVLHEAIGDAYCSGCGKLPHMKEHDEYCSVGKAEAAIAKALGEK